MAEPPEQLRALRSFIERHAAMLDSPDRAALQALAGDYEELLGRLHAAEAARARLRRLWQLAGRMGEGDASALAREVVAEGRAQLDAQSGYIARVSGLGVEFLAGTATPDAALEAAASRLMLVRPGSITAPMRVNGEWYVLGFHAGNAHVWADADREYVELLGSIFARGLERQTAAAQIEYLQDHDPLTRLPHRNRFHARLSEILSTSLDRDGAAVLIVDTDRFRQVVDEHGLETGDDVLTELASRIRLAKNERHELFRYRSDSFALLVHGNSALGDVHYLAERIIAAVARPMRIEGVDLHLTASIGIALYPSDGADPSSLAIAATTALRRAKRAGTGQFRFYNELLDERFGRRRLLAEELRDAARKNELVLYYQPIVNLQTREVIGAEALLRWHHPRRGIVGATEFVHVAEESDLINEIGGWVLQRAAMQARQWHDAGTPLIVAINLSARQFTDPGLLADVESALKSSGVPARLLEFEVTESIAMHDPDAAAYTLGCFRDLGLRVALDDFGTGHSSLAYLKRFPIDIIKLDQAFVAGLPEEKADAAIAGAVVALAASMACEVRAEGIELPAQEHYLRTIGVDSAQGFLIAPPLMPQTFERWIASSPRGVRRA